MIEMSMYITVVRPTRHISLKRDISLYHPHSATPKTEMYIIAGSSLHYETLKCLSSYTPSLSTQFHVDCTLRCVIKSGMYLLNTTTHLSSGTNVNDILLG